MALPGPSPLGGKSYPPVDAAHAFNAFAFVHHTVELPTRNLRVHVVECGPKEGVPVLMCHGFPELWMSWAHVRRRMRCRHALPLALAHCTAATAESTAATAAARAPQPRAT